MSEKSQKHAKRTTSQRSPIESERKKRRRKHKKMSEVPEVPANPEPKVATEVTQYSKPTENASFGDWANYILQEIRNSEKRTIKKIENYNTKLDKITRDYADHTRTLNKTTATVTKLIQENMYLKEKQSDLQEKLLKLEYHTRWNNLLFDGFEDSEYENSKESYNKVRRAIANLYDDDEDEGETSLTAYDKAGNIVINRIHRFDKYFEGRKRSIIVNFQYYGDVEHIKENRKHLPNGIYVNDDYPFEIQQRRNALRPILREAVKLPKYKGKVSLRYDKLVIFGKEYTMANIDQLPTDIKPENSCQKTENNVTGFFGMHSFLRNFHKASFAVDGERFTNAEQYIQAEKAASCDDDITRYKIMRCKDQREMKQLGRNIKNLDEQRWNREKARAVAYKGVLNKFQQNPQLGKKLKETGTAKLTECSRESPWGNGLTLNQTGSLDEAQWINGVGLLGEILMRVRDELPP